MPPFIHPTALVETKEIGDNTRIWAFVHILDGVTIGENCNICDHCFIENNVTIGSNVTIKSGVYIWAGTHIGDNVHIGPNVVFTNDLRPRSKKEFNLGEIHIRQGASVGANSTILAGVTIHEFAMTGIGSVITRDVKKHALVYGNPAKQKGWVDEFGEKLKQEQSGRWVSNSATYIEKADGLIREM